MSKTREQLEKWLKTIDRVEGRVIDIGGSQLPVLKRLNRYALHIDEYKILDLESPHYLAEKPDIVCDLNIGYFQEDQDPKDLTGYDVAFCLEVTEYFWNPIEAFEIINNLLKQGGLLYVSFHFVYPVHNPKDCDYLRYTPMGATKILQETGFEIINITPRLGEWDKTKDGMKPARDYASHNWVGCMIKCKKL